MSGEHDLEILLRDMDPVLADGSWVFVTVDGTAPEGTRATVVEDEGLSAIVPLDVAQAAGLEHDMVAAWITLGVHSALEAVGLTAAVSRVLAEAGMSCNVVAGRHHDHLLVPRDRADEALALLRGLGAG